MRFTTSFLIGMIFLGASLNGAEQASAAENPYGVCAHLNRWEYEQMPQELELMKKAGIRNVRTDLDWRQVEQEKGKWNFELWDSLVKEAEKNGISVLPILAGAQPRWGSPLVKHMDEWKNYLKTVLLRYKMLSHWEVVNEPDLNEFSNPEQYGTFLKETCRLIKDIRPDAVVLTGGFGNIPLPYLERMLKAGGKDSFDVMNVHPYYWKNYPEDSLAHELRELRKLMAKYGSGKKEIWMTETGYATATARDMKKITAAALEKLNLNRDDIPVALIQDPEYRYSSDGLNLDRKNFFSGKRKFHEISLKELKELKPRQYPLLLLAANEGFPMAYSEDLLNYVKNGGTLFFPGGGIPLYFDFRKLNGSIVREAAPEKIQQMFHIGWDAWWVNPKAPKGTRVQELAPGFGKDLPFPGSVSRFLSKRNLKPGDALIPVVTAYSKDRTYAAPVAAIYKFNSDLKGNIIAFTWSEYTDSVSREMQAKLLPRTYLTALSAGVDKIFWYSFRSMGQFPNAREHHFGVMERDLTPKPAYFAYKTLTEHRPAGSSRPILSEKPPIHTASWNKPDGDKVYALWLIRGSKDMKLSIRGNVKDVRDHLGKKAALKNNTLRISDGIIYITGSKDLSVECK